MKQFFIGVVVTLAVMTVIPLTCAGMGSFDVAATSKPGYFERHLAPWARDASVESRAPKGANPFAKDPTALDVGFDHYRANCVICHGAPGVEPGELAKGLNPHAPRLWSKDVETTPDGQTFWVIKNGIRMTGMPAFGPTHSDAEIWKIVAFIHHLNALSPAQVAALKTVTAEAGPPQQGAAAAPAPTGNHTAPGAAKDAHEKEEAHEHGGHDAK